MLKSKIVFGYYAQITSLFIHLFIVFIRSSVISDMQKIFNEPKPSPSDIKTDNQPKRKYVKSSLLKKMKDNTDNESDVKITRSKVKPRVSLF